MTRTTTTFVALTTLAALGLAASPPAARAAGGGPDLSLTLNSGDAVTVSAAGTHGTKSGTALNNTTTSYSGGTAVTLNGTAAFTLGAGGTVTGSSQYFYGLYAVGSGQVTVTGGTISDSAQGGYGLYARGSSPVTITGGSFTGGQGGSGLAAIGNTVTVSGGSFTAATGGYGLLADGGGIIDLFGTGFSYDVGSGPVPITSGVLPSSFQSGVIGTLSGTLLDGETLNAAFRNYATIEVNVGPVPAPEPSQTAALGLGVLGIGGLLLRAKKRSVIA